MIKKLLNFLFPTVSSFVVKEIDPVRNVVALEDKHLGIQLEVNIGVKQLKEVKITGQYCLTLYYKDGASEKIIFMK